jgi:hypothetical protein
LERLKQGKYNKSILAEVHPGALATGPYRRRRRRKRRRRRRRRRRRKVKVRALAPKVAGSNPAEAVGFLQT